jgi:hypothetical protein
VPDAGDERIALGPRVICEIDDFQEVALIDLDPTDRVFDFGLAHLEPVLGLEPLTVGVEESDERDRNVASLCRDENEIVEGLLFRRVEDHEVRKRLRPLCRPEICFVRVQAHQSSPGRGLEA